jgi:hypothetical protein
VNRVRILGFLVGATAFLVLALPASALAGTYTWNLASDFTATAPGANPDHDPYGGTPWSYEQGTSTNPSTFTSLPTFSVPDGLATWSASSGATVGINPTGSPIVDGTATVPAHQVFVEPSASEVAVVGWNSPLGEASAVSVNGSVSADAPTSLTCTYGTTLTLEEYGGATTTVLETGFGTSTATFSPTVAVPAGGSIFVTVANTGGATCDATGVSLQVQASGVAPTPVVSSPGPGSSTDLTAPTLSGAAGNGYGDASQVTLRVYGGGAVSGSPVETVTVPRSGASWSATFGSPLALGTYTVQAEQDDIVGDVGLSSPVTFTVRVPSISLASFGSKPLTTTTPTLTGTADTSAGADPFAVVQIYAGTTATGTPTRSLTTSLTASGQYSVPITPALPDGTYTALAAQGDAAGNTGFSGPQTFSVDTQAPVVTLVSPTKGSRPDVLNLLFKGAAGDQSFDSGVVTVSVYKGRKTNGKLIGTVQAKIKGSTWSVSWTKTLANGTYTALASQVDAVGHVGLSVAHTFTVVPLPPVIGRTATINKSGEVRLKVTCNERAGDGCSGNVLVLTRGDFQPIAGGPVGPLTVMFAYVHIKGGETATITRTVLSSVVDALRGHGNVAVTITATLHPSHGKAIHASARDNLRHIG